MNRFLDILARTAKAVRRTLRLRTRGVKVMLFNQAGEIMLIRNSYGDTKLWVFPGGGIHPFETPADAARREVREEVGVKTANLTFLSRHVSTAEGKRDTVWLFRAEVMAEPKADGFEVEEARFFALDGLPPGTSAATLRRIEDLGKDGFCDGPW